MLPVQWRSDMLKGIVRSYFGVEPMITVTGANGYLVLPEYRTLTSILGAVWGLQMIAMLWLMPDVPPLLLWSWLIFPLYYVVISFVLDRRRRAAAA